MNIKPIKNDDDYETALQEIDRLFDVSPNTPESDQLEILMTLLEDYENKHYDLPPPDPIDALDYYLDSRRLSPAALEPYIGSSTQVSDILHRRCPLTLAMIRRLVEGTGIPADILIQPYETTEGHQMIDRPFAVLHEA